MKLLFVQILVQLKSLFDFYLKILYILSMYIFFQFLIDKNIRNKIPFYNLCDQNRVLHIIKTIIQFSVFFKFFYNMVFNHHHHQLWLSIFLTKFSAKSLLKFFIIFCSIFVGVYIYSFCFICNAKSLLLTLYNL